MAKQSGAGQRGAERRGARQSTVARGIEEWCKAEWGKANRSTDTRRLAMHWPCCTPTSPAVTSSLSSTQVAVAKQFLWQQNSGGS